jgi:hypothetical protein
MTQVTLIAHREVESDTECEGRLISQYINNVECSECGARLTSARISDAQEKIADHQTFYGLALVLVED